MRRFTSSFALVCTALTLCLGLAGCPSDPVPGTDAGRDAASVADAASELDAPSSPDAFSASDAPSSPDAYADRDAPEAADAWRDTCPMGLGMFCEDGAVCPTGYECMVGRCAPQGRMLCGGFAGARCTDPGYSACTYFSSADFGPCLTPEERRCICDDPERAAGFDCP